MRVVHETIIPAGTDVTTSPNSLPALLAHAWGCSIQAIFTGSPVGTVKLQGSSDVAPDANFSAANFSVINWTDISGSSQSISSAGNVAWDISRTGFSWIRVVYTSSSGAGTITAQIFTKGF